MKGAGGTWRVVAGSGCGVQGGGGKQLGQGELLLPLPVNCSREAVGWGQVRDQESGDLDSGP